MNRLTTRCHKSQTPKLYVECDSKFYEEGWLHWIISRRCPIETYECILILFAVFCVSVKQLCSIQIADFFYIDIFDENRGNERACFVSASDGRIQLTHFSCSPKNQTQYSIFNNAVSIHKMCVYYFWPQCNSKM